MGYSFKCKRRELHEISFGYRFRSIVLDPIFLRHKYTNRKIYPTGRQVFDYNNNVDLQKNRLQRLYLATRVTVTQETMERKRHRERRE